MDNVKKQGNLLNPYKTKLRAYQLATQYQIPYYSYKKGGSLTYAQKYNIEASKIKGKKEIKDVEQFYKAIFHNNEMLQKSLIKVFK